MNHTHLEVPSSHRAKRAFLLRSHILFLALCLVSVATAAAQGKKPGALMAPAATSYTKSAVTYDFLEIAGSGNYVMLSDDEVSSAVPIGFDFSFYGVDYTELYISSNGFVTFLPDQSPGCCEGRELPAEDDNNGLIAGFWGDLYPSMGGGFEFGRTKRRAAGLFTGVFHQTVGEPGSRVFIVQYNNVPYCCESPSPSTSQTFQIKLFEGSNNIEVHYVQTRADGSVNSAGIENVDGTAGVQHYFGTGTVDDNSAVRYAPGAPTAADVTVAGRVATSDGRGIRNVTVILTGANSGMQRTALTGPFGYYTFEGLDAGAGYIVSVRAKRFRFADNNIFVSPSDSLFNVDFIALP